MPHVPDSPNLKVMPDQQRTIVCDRMKCRSAVKAALGILYNVNCDALYFWLQFHVVVPLETFQVIERRGNVAYGAIKEVVGLIDQAAFR